MHAVLGVDAQFDVRQLEDLLECSDFREVQILRQENLPLHPPVSKVEQLLEQHHHSLPGCKCHIKLECVAHLKFMLEPREDQMTRSRIIEHKKGTVVG